MLRFAFRTSIQCFKNQKQCLNKDYNRHLVKKQLNKQVVCSIFPTPKRLFTTYNNNDFQLSGPLKHFSRTFSTASNYCLNQAEHDTKKEVQNTGILSSMYGDSYQKQKQDENNKKNEEENKESIQVS